tara:strand:- start:128 stop:1657 length:1530 start_codon:yes stop_codon:yes gene_type:complete
MSNDVVRKLEANVVALLVSEIPGTATETESENQLAFPKDAIGENPISRMAQEVARVYGVPPQLPYMLGLAVVSIAMQRAFQIFGAFDKPRYGNIFLMGIARSATGKSNIFKDFMDPLLKRQRKFDEEFQKAKRKDSDDIEILRDERKDIMAAIRKKKKEDWRSDDPEWRGEKGQIEVDLAAVNEEIATLQNRVQQKLFVDNITPEALGERLSETDGYLGIASPEAADVLDIFSGRYAGNKPQLALLNKGFSSDPHLVDRRGDGDSRTSFTIEQATLAIALLVQPDKALEFFSMSQVNDQGTLGRFSLFDARMELKKRTSDSRSFDTTVRAEWERFLNILIDMPRGSDVRRIVECTTNARRVSDEYYNEQVEMVGEVAVTPLEEQMRLRSCEKANAFALILNVADNPNAETLDANTMIRAIQIEKWLLSSGLRFVGTLIDHKSDANLKKIADVVGRKGTITRSQLQHSHNFTAAQVNAFAEAVEDGRIRGVSVNRERAANNQEMVSFVAT